MTRCLIFLVATAVLAIAPLAAADRGEWYIAGAAVYTDDDGRRNLDDSVAGGEFNVGFEFTDSLSLEGSFGYSDIYGFPGQEHIDVSLNLLSHLSRGPRFSPYILAGVGYLGTETTTGSEENRPTVSAGLGARIRLGQSRFSLRAEYYARFAIEQGYTFTDRIAALGLQYTFGDAVRTGMASAVTDSDGDGIPDDVDQCPYSEAGFDIDPVGCEVFPDADRDGVMDRKDQCPDTPAGAVVDSAGCIGDLDGDGIRDDVDQCPGTASGAAIDARGCARDGDQDGIANHRDRCPNTPADAKVDDDGCEVIEIIELRGVNFASNSDRLLRGAEQILDDAATWLKQRPDLLVEVAGHTDSAGNDQLNLGLSERRAYTVRDYLISRGVSPASLTARGYGESEPIADNVTAEGKAENRRVELRIIGRR